MKASNLNFATMRHFSKAEWPGDVLDHMDAEVLRLLSTVRNRVPRNHGWTPSPVERGHVRHESSGSRHRAHERRSDATDGFVRWSHLWRWWVELQREPGLGGLGVYLDMTWGGTFRARPMLHIDCRPDRVVWVAWRDNRDDPLNYTYLLTEPVRFHQLIAERTQG